MVSDAQGAFPPRFEIPAKAREEIEREERQSLLDVHEGIERREEAIERVDENADAHWKADAHRAWLEVLRTHPFRDLITDPVWDLLDAWEVPAPHERRAMGPVNRRLADEGYIEKLKDAAGNNVMRQSALPQNHRRPMQVWRILRRSE